MLVNEYRFAIDTRTKYNFIEFIPNDLVDVRNGSISMGIKEYYITPIKSGELTVVYKGDNIPDAVKTSIIE